MEAGTILAGRYRLLRAVGRGGLASVWEAEHVALGSPVAIKFLHRTGPRDGELSQRFLREARIAASVRHRNVLDILDFGFAEATSGDTSAGDTSADDAVPYMAMELLNGRTLGALLAAQPRPPLARTIDIVAGTLRGLSAVHDSGLVHRDIKPDNVFLVEDEDGAFPKLVDFGLSRRSGRGDLTEEGMLLGTPQYMSPEQAAGLADLDARTDIYAVGVVLYEMLAGRRPFASGSLAETIDRVLHETPARLSDVAPDVPAPLVEVVETAMDKDRERRFVDARAMRSALLAAMPSVSTVSVTSPPVRVDAYAQTLAGVPAVVLPAPDTETPRVASLVTTVSPGARPPPPRESRIVVALRVLVLAAITIGVAVLVLDWRSGAAEIAGLLGGGGASGDALAAAVALTDAGPEALLDLGPMGAGRHDAGPTDAGPTDAGPTDAGPTDAGPTDAGPMDAGPMDAGPMDAGLVVGDLDAGEDAAPKESELHDAAVAALDAAADDTGVDLAGAVDAAPRTVRAPRAARPTRHRATRPSHPPRRRSGRHPRRRR